MLDQPFTIEELYILKCHNEPKIGQAFTFDCGKIIQRVSNVLDFRLCGQTESFFELTMEQDVKINEDKSLTTSNHRIVIDYGHMKPHDCDRHGDVHWMEIGFDGIVLVLNAVYVKSKRYYYNGRRSRGEGKPVYVPLAQAVMPAMQFKGVKPMHWVDEFTKQAFARIMMTRNMMRTYGEYSLDCVSASACMSLAAYGVEDTHGHHRVPVAKTSQFKTKNTGLLVNTLNKLAKQYRNSNKLKLLFCLKHRKLEKVYDGYSEYYPTRWPNIDVFCEGQSIQLSLDYQWFSISVADPSSDASIVLQSQNGITKGVNAVYHGESMLSLASRIFLQVVRIHQAGGFKGKINE